VMRTPLQILFLILVTDLPPSIALGMEPGEATILQDRPRPKTEPVVLSWMWLSMVMNGAVLSAVIIVVYFIALQHYCEGKVFQADINLLDNYNDKLMDARTVAFISLVWSENVRSYTSRSFNKPVWNNFLGNKKMQQAIVLAQLALYAAVLIPFFSDRILGLRGIEVGAFGWLLALVGPIGCVVLCELCKLITAMQAARYQEELALNRASVEPQQQMIRSHSKSKQQATPVIPGVSDAPRVAKKATEKMAPVHSEKKPKANSKKGWGARAGCSCFGLAPGLQGQVWINDK